jgi:serine/threonine-protein kinase
VAHTDTRIGTEIAGYRVVGLLGRGGMSVVYVAEHMRLGRNVALKLLASELTHDESYRTRFIQESRIAASIDHPNIIPIYDAGEADGVLYIAMRHIEGADLGALLRAKGPLGLGQAVFVIEQLASALDVAHAHGLIHRDVKPANVLIEANSERVFLTDFGVAKQVTDAGLTKTGYFLGSVEYAAPEQIECQPVDARTDIYALGGVLYSSLTALAPYEKSSEIAVASAHISEPPPRVTAHRPGLPTGIDAVVERAMSKSMDARYDTCGALVAAARTASLSPVTHSGTHQDGMHILDAPPTEVGRPPPTAPTPVAVPATRNGPAPTAASSRSARRWRRVAVPAIAAVVAALGAGLAVYFVTRDGGTHATKADTMQTATTTTSDAVTPAAALDSYVEGWPWTCHDSATPAAGATASMDCTTRHGPDSLQVNVYEKMAPMMAAYDQFVSDSPSKPSTGKCNAAGWGGEDKWSHGSGGDVGGRRVCYVRGGDSYLIWTLQGTPQALFVARHNDQNHRPLFFWWVNMRHVTFSDESMKRMEG